MDEATAAEVTPFLDQLADALIAGDPDGIARCLAPWLGSSAAAELWDEIQRVTEDIDGATVGPPDTSELYDNPLGLEELREDAELPDEISDERFTAWCCISIRADAGDTPLYDLWCAVVRSDAGLAIGYYEVEPPE